MVITDCILSGRWMRAKVCGDRESDLLSPHVESGPMRYRALLWFSPAGRQSWITAHYYDLLTQTFVGEKVLPNR